MPLPRACIECGESIPSGSRCADCRLARDRSNLPSREARGYDYRYRTIRARALRLQPWCTDCGTDQQLSVDHSKRSWELIKQGQRPTMQWFAEGLLTVVCMPCNRRRGNARGAGVTRRD